MSNSNTTCSHIIMLVITAKLLVLTVCLCDTSNNSRGYNLCVVVYGKLAQTGHRISDTCRLVYHKYTHLMIVKALQPKVC